MFNADPQTRARIPQNCGQADGHKRRLRVRIAADAFPVAKRAFDILVSVFVLIPVALLCAAVLLVLNPLFNAGGPLFYVQSRMGRNCTAFRAIKFRTMRGTGRITRKASGPLEHDRITTLGRFLRETHLDELPQAVNVLRGEMSLIGPRPDYFEHATEYLRLVPGYRTRHTVRPGISGLAQTELGYADGLDATRAKVLTDLRYIENAGFKLDAWIVWRTVVTVFRCNGS